MELSFVLGERACSYVGRELGEGLGLKNAKKDADRWALQQHIHRNKVRIYLVPDVARL